MHKIIPHLWFNTQAKEAAQFYVDTFGGDSKVTSTATIHDTPSGDTDMLTFTLAGQPFMAISAGPLFKFNPSISFLVSCETKEEVERLWKQLSDGGSTYMPLGSYPFSESFGWLQDKYGLSWQLMFLGDRPMKQKITPVLMFTQNMTGKAEEAMKFYCNVFDNASIDGMMRYGKDEAPDTEGTVRFADFTLEGQHFAAMDSAREHNLTFSEAISLVVQCQTQDDIDAYWEKLSAVPQAEQCGWLKDKYGVSWQIVPTAMQEMMSNGDAAAIARVTQAFLKMKKFDIATLEKAYKG